MSRRYSLASQGSDEESPDDLQPDWPEIRFPVKIAKGPGDRTDYSLYEFSAEVTTPNDDLEQGDVRLRGGSLFVRFQPYEAGVHEVQVLADGMEFCPPLFFEVMPDGSHRRLKAAPQGHHPAASRRQPASHHPVGRRGSFSRASEDDDDEPGLRGRGVHRSSSRASASSIQRRGSIRSEDSLERFAAASARYSIAGSSDGSRPGSAGGLRRRSQSNSARK